MSLDNLLGKTLEKITPDRPGITRLLEAAQRNIADSNIELISNENRFDVAYKAIMQLSNIALSASGYRTLTSVPGHHQTMIQSLTKTIDIETDTMIILDSLRKQRNIADYSGDTITETTMITCTKHAKELLFLVEDWLKNHKPELIELGN